MLRNCKVFVINSSVNHEAGKNPLSEMSFLYAPDRNMKHSVLPLITADFVHSVIGRSGHFYQKWSDLRHLNELRLYFYPFTATNQIGIVNNQ